MAKRGRTGTLGAPLSGVGCDPTAKFLPFSFLRLLFGAAPARPDRGRVSKSWATTLPAPLGTRSAACQLFPSPSQGLGLAVPLQEALQEPEGFGPIWPWVCARGSWPESPGCRRSPWGIFLLKRGSEHRPKNCRVAPSACGRISPRPLQPHQGSIVVGIDYDCRERTVYWTDVAGRTINRASLEPGAEPETVISSGVSPPPVSPPLP